MKYVGSQTIETERLLLKAQTPIFDTFRKKEFYKRR